jgi:RNA polymerase sigma-70 factor (ECF subfamily)
MDNPTGWMVKSLKNESLQYFRSIKKIEPIEGIDFQAGIEEDKEGVSERVNLVFQFLEKLPDKQREIFELREVEGLTYEEIAEYLEISLDQVKVNLHRARKALRDYFIVRNEKSTG